MAALNVTTINASNGGENKAASITSCVYMRYQRRHLGAETQRMAARRRSGNRSKRRRGVRHGIITAAKHYQTSGQAGSERAERQISGRRRKNGVAVKAKRHEWYDIEGEEESRGTRALARTHAAAAQSSANIGIKSSAIISSSTNA